MAHYPGPWRNEGNSVKALNRGRWFTIAKACAHNFTPDGNLYHAGFLAAAPDMYEALKVAYDILQGHGIGSEHYDRIRDALSRARGE